MRQIIVVTPSAAMLRALNTHYGSIRNARVIHNGRDPENFKPRLKRNFILSAGRLWDEAKNINRVAGIASELPWPVLVAGDFHQPDQPIQEIPLAKECRWLGSLSELQLRRWFAAASLYALPALYEPFGYTPLEAALSGCALVLGQIESLREIWGDAAVFVDPNDSKALQQALTKHGFVFVFDRTNGTPLFPIESGASRRAAFPARKRPESSRSRRSRSRSPANC